MGTGSIIFYGLLGIYFVLGPLVLLVIYTMLDRYARKRPDRLGESAKGSGGSVDPAFWSSREVLSILKRQAELKGKGRL